LLFVTSKQSRIKYENAIQRMGMCYKRTCQQTPAGVVATPLMVFDQGSTDAVDTVGDWLSKTVTSTDGSFDCPKKPQDTFRKIW